MLVKVLPSLSIILSPVKWRYKELLKIVGTKGENESTVSVKTLALNQWLVLGS